MSTLADLTLLANGQTPDWMKFAFMVMAILVGSFYAMYKWYHG
jgi:hypothetical protein